MPQHFNIFHKAGTVFLGLAFVLFLVYFMIAAGGAQITAESEGSKRWKAALRRTWQITIFIAILSYANLLPDAIEKSTVGILQAGLNLVRPIAAKIPFVNGFL